MQLVHGLTASALVLACSCSTTRGLHDPALLTPTGKAVLTEQGNAMAYSVATTINAPPDVIWAILTDAPAYPSWNSTIVRVGGHIAPGQKIALVAKVAPDRTFDLTVSEFVPGQRMVWEDGNRMFQGVRTFTLTPGANGTTHFGMEECFSGAMLRMIKGKLPDFRASFEGFASDLKRAAEARNAPAVEQAGVPAVVEPSPAITPGAEAASSTAMDGGTAP